MENTVVVPTFVVVEAISKKGVVCAPTVVEEMFNNPHGVDEPTDNFPLMRFTFPVLEIVKRGLSFLSAVSKTSSVARVDVPSTASLALGVVVEMPTCPCPLRIIILVIFVPETVFPAVVLPVLKLIFPVAATISM